MSSAPSQMAMFEVVPSSDVVINGRCILQSSEGRGVITICGLPVLSFDEDDGPTRDMCLMQLMEAGYATVGELTAAQVRNRRTLHRLRQRYEAGGAAGMLRRKPGPKGPRMGRYREDLVRKLHDEGMSVRGMARRLQVSPGTMLATVRRLGLTSAKRGAVQPDLSTTEPVTPPAAEVPPVGVELSSDPIPSAGPGHGETRGEGQTEVQVPREVPASGEVPAPGEPGPLPMQTPSEEHTDVEAVLLPMPQESMDTEPLHRQGDRLMAALGLLDDAAPLFASALAVPRAGVLLALPVLMRSGLLDTAHNVYGHIGPAFYGLRTCLVAFVLFALLRIKRAENLKQYNPTELGRLLGLDRAPEVKTLRRKLRELADSPRADDFLKKLLARRVEARSEALGYLYVDGHLRVYHGQHKLPKTHSCRLRMSLPATQDVWVHDAQANPVMVLTQPGHPQLVGALPGVMKGVRQQVGADRRVTFIFDRGGWSPKLFKQMDADLFDVITYYKGPLDPIPDDCFTDYTVEVPGGLVTYSLYERSVALLNGSFWMRQVIRKQGAHQTAIMTTRHDLALQEVARRMFGRWGQENFFKYMRQEYALDALVQYGAEADDQARLVPNPARKSLDKLLLLARQEVLRLQASYGAAAARNTETRRPTMRGFKIAHGTTLGIPLRRAQAQVKELQDQRQKLPTHVSVAELPEQVVRLLPNRKRFSDTLKMLAYQVETDLVRLVALLYPRCRDEGRRLLMTALHSAADIDVTHKELRITLAPQSSPHRTQVVADLCELLNGTKTCFPGTSLMLRFAIHGAQSVPFDEGG